VGAPDAEAAALALGDPHRLAQARANRCGGVAGMDHERAAADCGAVDRFPDQAAIMRNCDHRIDRQITAFR
jgi:hypothetical protein